MLPLATAQNLIGYLGCGVCAAMFGGPLASMQAVLRDRSAASIPIGFTLFSTVNTSVWLGYGESPRASSPLQAARPTRPSPLDMSCRSPRIRCSPRLALTPHLRPGAGLVVLGDPFIWAPNVLGLASSLTQMGLIARFGTAPRVPDAENGAAEARDESRPETHAETPTKPT